MILTATAQTTAPESQKLMENFAHCDDLTYCDRFIKPLRRQQSLLGRTLVRALLAKMTATDPSQWNLSPIKKRPWLATNQLTGKTIFFSISHSQQWVGIAASDEVIVGIDVELINRQRDMTHLLAGIISDTTVRLPSTVAGQYMLWSAFEAYCKARHQRLVFPIPPVFLSVDWDHNPVTDCLIELDNLGFTLNAHRCDQFSWALCQGCTPGQSEQLPAQGLSYDRITSRDLCTEMAAQRSAQH